MTFRTFFRHADEVFLHLNTVVPSLRDPLLEMKYKGFATIASVTVYEMAIKGVLSEFGRKKNKALSSFIDSHFGRINGRIRLDSIRNDYIAPFGTRYLERFERKLFIAKTAYMLAHRRDFVSGYSNLIVWRNDFAHEGKTSSLPTYAELARSYEDGKEVIRCFAETMVR